MKKLLSTLMILFAPSSAFGLIGFGIQGVSDLSKFETYTYSDGGVNINSYAMESNPFGLGGYAFIDLFGYALEAEVDVAAGEYEFDFGNEIMGTVGPIPFGWARVSYAFTFKKNIMDISIPFLAKAAINAGGGFGSHLSTPRADFGMVQALFDGDLMDLNVDQDVIKDRLGDYLKDNLTETNGLHLQAGLRFKVLVLDTHLNARYNLAKDVYTGKNGFLQLAFKAGFAF